MTFESREEFIAHYGVKGMRWGKRKGGVKPAKAGSSEDAVRKSDLLQKPLHTMTNNEIKSLNERLQLEKTYRQLTTESTSKGSNYVKRLLGTAKTAQEVYTVANSPMVKDIQKLLDAKTK